MESYREDGTVITETVDLREESRNKAQNRLSFAEDYQQVLDSRPSFENNMGCIKNFEVADLSSDENVQDVVDIFGDDWIGKPGVSSSSDEEIPVQESPQDPKRRRNRSKEIPSNISIVEGDPMKYKCTICVKVFSSKGHIRYHAYCGLTEKPFKCHLCPKSFSKKTALTYHIKTHTGERPFVCSMCDKSFLQLDKLKRHKMTHVGNQLECEKCHKKFRDTYSLNVHTRTHIDLSSNIFNCDTCSKNFKDKSTLNKHVRGVHSASKQYFCEHCGKGFDWKFNLVCHLRTHSGVRAYACDRCSRTFKNYTDRRKHLLTHTDRKEYKCSVCKGDFKRRDNLIRHLRNIHPESQVTNIVKVSGTKVPNYAVGTSSTDTTVASQSCNIIVSTNKSNVEKSKNVNSMSVKRPDNTDFFTRIPGECIGIPSAPDKNLGQCSGLPSNISRMESRGIGHYVNRVTGESGRVTTVADKTSGESSAIPLRTNKTDEPPRIVSYSNVISISSNSSSGNPDITLDYSFCCTPNGYSTNTNCQQYNARQSHQITITDHINGTCSYSDTVSGDTRESCDANRISVIRNLTPSQSSSGAQQSVIKHSRESADCPHLEDADAVRECVIKSTNQ